MKLWFSTYLTEEEHGIVSYELLSYCKKNEVDFRYYKKFRPHRPAYRQCLLSGEYDKIMSALLYVGIDPIDWRSYD
jgi:hypothetical protein